MTWGFPHLFGRGPIVEPADPKELQNDGDPIRAASPPPIAELAGLTDDQVRALGFDVRHDTVTCAHGAALTAPCELCDLATLSEGL